MRHADDSGDADHQAKVAELRRHVLRLQDSPSLQAVAATHPEIASAFDLAFNDPALVCNGARTSSAV